MATLSAEAVARTQWEASNSVITSDDHWKLDKVKMEAMYRQKPRPWTNDPRYFNRVYMSCLSALRILVHAKTGQGKKGRIGCEKNNWVEVMGLIQGHFYDNTLVITDSFALPVDASEVECSMNEHSINYMIESLQRSRDLGKDEGCIGWYHSHPGYSCFLSGIDVNTQRNNQSVQDPWIAVVVDPVQSMASGKIEIRAFRTLPQSASTSSSAQSSSSNINTSAIPADKIAELGVYVNEYYELPITLFRSQNDAKQLELLWSKYWATVLASSPWVANRPFLNKQIRSLNAKMDSESKNKATPAAAAASSKQVATTTPSAGQWVVSAQAISCDVLQSLVFEEAKDRVFGSVV